VKLVLASESPRRRELLSTLGLPFDIVPAGIDEDANREKERPERLARRLARAKAAAVASSRPEAFVVGADTVVALRGRLLGKPRDATEAPEMLRALRGRSHRVVTAVAVVPPGQQPLVDHVTTRVTMRRYTDEEIAASVKRGDPFDKAGGYAIQDKGLRPAAGYEGCYCNVVGLPLRTVVRLLGRLGVDITSMAHGNLPVQCERCPVSIQ
jgi:MAF protein